MSFGLLMLRLVVGLTFAAHGAQKLFGWFGGQGLAGTGAVMEQYLGFRPGKRAALLAGLTEIAGGLLLALGAATPLAAASLIGVMLVAVVGVHLAKGFFSSDGGYEFNLVLATVALTLAIAGPGRYSIDAWIGREYAGIGWGLAALAVGLAGGALQLASRRAAAATPAAIEPDAQPIAKSA